MAFLGDDGRLDDVTDEALEGVGKGTAGPLAEGWYRVALIDDEVQSKDWGTGLNMQFQILSGDFENRRIFDYLCLRHSRSEEAERIARAKLKSFALAAGAKDPDNVQDTAELYSKPVMLRGYRQKDDTKYAEEDGKKFRVAEFVSVETWKAQHADEPTPGLTIKSRVPTNTPKAEPAPPPSDDSIPF